MSHVSVPPPQPVSDCSGEGKPERDVLRAMLHGDVVPHDVAVRRGPGEPPGRAGWSEQATAASSDAAHVSARRAGLRMAMMVTPERDWQDERGGDATSGVSRLCP